MSFPVAFQSAVFYVLACTPCTQIRHRQKAKDQAKKERLEKAKLETEQPGLYRHPSPFNTNPYWQDEISMGPSLPKKSTSKNSSQRGLTSAGRESSTLSMSDRTNVGDSRVHFGDSTTAMDDALSEDWNTRHGYQREDEELWGEWSGHKLKDAFSKARDSAGRLIESTLGSKEVTEQERRDFYFAPRNAPINDYHPPVVSSKQPHKDAHKWMLQPPPPAKVMEGKVPVSRAASSCSRASARTMMSDETNLSRMVQEKLVKERMMKQANPTESELIESLFAPRNSRSSFQRSRSLSFDGSEDSLENPFDRRRRSRLRPLAAPLESESDDDFEDVFAPRLTKTYSHSGATTRAAQRPKLATIPSSGNSSRRSQSNMSRRQRSSRIKAMSPVGSPVGDDTD